MWAHSADPQRQTDVAELYRALSTRLAQLVRAAVRAPDPLIEEACQVAWSRLVAHRDRVRREAVLAWLATTATREALRMLRCQRREVSLEQLTELDGPAPEPGRCSLEELVEQRARLASIRELPERQQRLVWLQGLGLSYTEMAGYTGASTRTVERQLLRAKRSLRAA